MKDFLKEFGFGTAIFFTAISLLMLVSLFDAFTVVSVLLLALFIWGRPMLKKFLVTTAIVLVVAWEWVRGLFRKKVVWDTE
ncbi:MAG: hypothetical protein WC705_02780 [Candidatus Paceibacterota bacterium]